VSVRALVLLAAIAVIFCVVYFAVGSRQGDASMMVVSGTVEAYDVSVGSKVGGRLAELHVDEGDHVDSGQLLAVFDVPELEARSEALDAELAEAQSVLARLANGARPEEIAQARALLDAAQSRLDLLESGTREEDIAVDAAALESAEVDLDLAKVELARAEELFRQDVIPRSELDKAQARVGSLEQAVEQSRQNLLKAQDGFRDEEIGAARAELDYARQSLKLVLAGSRAEDIERALANIDAVEAQIAELEVSLEESSVTAPAAAVVLATGYQPGDLILPGGEVARLLLDGRMFIQIFVPQDKLGWAAPGSTARIEVDTFPGEYFNGEVTYLSTQGEFTPRNLQTKEKRVEEVFRAKVQVDDDTGRLRPGMVCDVIFSRPGAAGNGE